MKTTRGRWVSALCAGALAAGGARAATRYVAPTGSDTSTCTVQAQPCQTIGFAVQAAANDDTIRVLPGTYNECVSMLGKRLTLVADAFETSQDRTRTVIDGTDQCDGGNGFYVPTVTIGTRSEIRGFTIRGGGDSGVLGVGGAVITRNVITGNSAMNSDNKRGGGVQGLTTLVYTDTAPLKIEYNDITNNQAFYWGGGIFIESRVDPTHRRDVSVKGNNILTNSTAGTSTGGTTGHNSGGGGIWIQSYAKTGATSSIVVTGNVIQGNSSPTAVGGYGTVGGGIFAASYAYAGGTDDIQIKGNQIRSNRASQFGGGAALFTYTTFNNNVRGTGSIKLQANIVEANTVTDAQGSLSNDSFGGGVFAETAGDGNETILVGGPNATTDFNTIQNNVALTIAGGIAAWGFPSNTGIQLVKVQNNVITQNQADGGGGVDLFMTQTDRNGARGQVLLTGNSITGNHAIGSLYGTGGGIQSFAESTRSETQSSIDIVDNDIQINTATVAGGGAWMALAANGRPAAPPPPAAAHAVAQTTFVKNLVTGNTAHAPAGQAPAIGGGAVGTIDAEGDALVFLHVNFATIAANTDDAGVGGLELETFTDFEDPLAQTGPNGEARAWVRNSILTGNSGVELGGPEPGVDTGGSANVTLHVDYNDIFGTMDPWITLASPNHNLLTDPGFVRGFLPGSCSPTVDAADPIEDPSQEPAPNGGIANMGHTGGTSQAAVTLPDLNNDLFVDGVDILQISISFAAQFGEPRYLDTADVDRNGVVDGEDLGIVANEFGTGCQ